MWNFILVIQTGYLVRILVEAILILIMLLIFIARRRVDLGQYAYFEATVTSGSPIWR